MDNFFKLLFKKWWISLVIVFINLFGLYIKIKVLPIKAWFVDLIYYVVIICLFLILLCWISGIVYLLMRFSEKRRERRRQNDFVEKSKRIGLHSFIQNSRILVERLNEKGLMETSKGLLQGFSEIPSAYGTFFLKDRKLSFIPDKDDIKQSNFRFWDQLSGVTIKKYFEGLNDSRRNILFSNFRIYAFCVAGITDFLMEDKKRDRSRVVVWTVLNKPLWRWFNMIDISDNFFASPYWWETYLGKVRNLNSKKPNGMQMRRLIVVREDEIHGKRSVPRKLRNVFTKDDKHMYIYKNAMTLNDLEKEIGSGTFNKADLFCYQKDSRIPKKVDNGTSEENKICKIYPISCNKINSDWRVIEAKFEEEFGEFDTIPFNNVEPGVFNKIIRFNENKKRGQNKANSQLMRWIERYDDIFVVQFVDESKQTPKTFGIAFKENKKDDDKGVVILDQGTINGYLKALSKVWNN